MFWSSKKKTSYNELGDYLPDEDAHPYEQSEEIGVTSKLKTLGLRQIV